MNERIGELVRKSGGYEKDDDGEETKIAVLVGKDVEKFAELIVKETMQVVANQLPSNQYLDVACAVIEHYKE